MDLFRCESIILRSHWVMVILDEFKQYYNASRTHYSLEGQTPEEKSGVPSAEIISLNQYQWEEHCRGLFQTPIAA